MTGAFNSILPIRRASAGRGDYYDGDHRAPAAGKKAEGEREFIGREGRVEGSVLFFKEGDGTGVRYWKSG